MRYDILILGADEAAQAAALAAARAGRRVALVVLLDPAWEGLLEAETPATLSVPAALRRFIAGRPPYAPLARSRRGNVLRSELVRIAREESETVVQHLSWNGVEVFAGTAEFANARTVTVTTSCMSVEISADTVVVATGTRSHRPSYVPFDGRRILVVEDLLRLETLPQELAIIGAGSTGLAAATALALCGTRVVLIEQRDARLLDDGARELRDRAEVLGVEVRNGAEAIGVESSDAAAVVCLADGAHVTTTHVAWCACRVAATDGLNLAAAGLETDERGRLWCDEELRTWAPHVFAAGEAVGFPRTVALAAQGRRIVRRCFGEPVRPPKSPALVHC